MTPRLPPNPVCPHGLPGTVGLHIETKGDMQIITGTMVLCPRCALEMAGKVVVK